jgi:hypothetical protein
MLSRMRTVTSPLIERCARLVRGRHPNDKVADAEIRDARRRRDRTGR